MHIRTYQPGHEIAQVEIYNEAAGGLSKFKPGTVEEVRRRCQAPGFDPATRFYAEEGGRVVGYAVLHDNGRVSYPWCRRGSEIAARPLFVRVLEALRQRGIRRAFAAYRGDWPAQEKFFLDHGFHHARDMVNFILEVSEAPTRTVRGPHAFSPMRREDVPAVRRLGPKVCRAQSDEALDRHLFENPYFGPEALFALRPSPDAAPVAVGILIRNPAYANPRLVDPGMPCFRLGAFGTEGMHVKRIHGLFSVLAAPDADFGSHASAVLDQAACRLDRGDVTALAAQAPSDAPHLEHFYRGKGFRRQGSFPVLEREL
jgi:hypothetical protein